MRKHQLALGALFVALLIAAVYQQRATAPTHHTAPADPEILKLLAERSTLMAALAALNESFVEPSLVATGSSSLSAKASPQAGRSPQPFPQCLNVERCLSRRGVPGCEIAVVQVGSEPLIPYLDNPTAYPPKEYALPAILDNMTFPEPLVMANYHYAHLRGYYYVSVFVESDALVGKRTVEWQKVAVARAMLEHFGAILLLDNYAHVRESLFKIEDEFATCNLRDGGNVVAAAVSRDGSHTAIAGTMLLRNNDATRQFLADWWNSIPEKELPTVSEDDIMFKAGSPTHEKWKDKMCVKGPLPSGQQQWEGCKARVIARQSAALEPTPPPDYPVNYDFVHCDRKWIIQTALDAAGLHILHLMDCLKTPGCCPPDYNMRRFRLSDLDFSGFMNSERTKMV